MEFLLQVQLGIPWSVPRSSWVLFDKLFHEPQFLQFHDELVLPNMKHPIVDTYLSISILHYLNISAWMLQLPILHVDCSQGSKISSIRCTHFFFISLYVSNQLFPSLSNSLFLLHRKIPLERYLRSVLLLHVSCTQQP